MHIKIGKVEHCEVHAQALEPLQSEVLDKVKVKLKRMSGTNYPYKHLKIENQECTPVLDFKIKIGYR